MKIAVCDDELYWVDVLTEMVSSWGEARGVDFEIKRFLSLRELIDSVFSRPGFDLVLLDISFENEAIDGMTAAGYLNKAGVKTPIVFVTSDALRADEGYLVEAKGYLKKPIDGSKLALFLDRVLDGRKPDKFIKINSKGKVISVNQADIVYIEVLGKTVLCHTHTDVFEYRSTLSGVMRELEDGEFVQVHKSYLVRKDKIRGVRPAYPAAVTLMKGSAMANIPVGRKYVANVLDTYSNDVLRKML